MAFEFQVNHPCTVLTRGLGSVLLAAASLVPAPPAAAVPATDSDMLSKEQGELVRLKWAIDALPDEPRRQVFSVLVGELRRDGLLAQELATPMQKLPQFPRDRSVLTPELERQVVRMICEDIFPLSRPTRSDLFQWMRSSDVKLRAMSDMPQAEKE